MNLFVLLGIIGLSSLILTMIGLGGGLVFSPLFVLLGFPKSMAVAASLFLNGIAAASASLVYIRKKMVDFSVALPIIIASSIGAPLGALTTHRVDTRIFMMIMMSVVLAAALRMLFSSKGAPKRPEAGRSVKILGGGSIGLAIGFLGGMLGIGGGVFVVPMLIYFIGISTRTAAASSAFIVCFSSLTGFITHASISSIDWRFILWAALFSFVGGQIGSRIMAEKLRGRTIRIVFGVVLMGFFFKLLQRTFF